MFISYPAGLEQVALFYYEARGLIRRGIFGDFFVSIVPITVAMDCSDQDWTLGIEFNALPQLGDMLIKGPAILEKIDVPTLLKKFTSRDYPSTPGV